MKRITIFVVLVMAMVLCLALVGCGQNTDKQDAGNTAPVSNDEGGKGKIDDTNPTQNAEPADNGQIDNFNPKQDASGLYVYDVQGHEIHMGINIWDYINDITIDDEVIHDFFYLKFLAKDLGYAEKYNLDGLYKKTFEDGSYAIGGFQHDGSSGESHITASLIDANENSLGAGGLYVEPYNLSKMTYQYNKGYYINLDMIILCAYSMEYYANGTTGDCWVDIFGEQLPRIAP